MSFPTAHPQLELDLTGLPNRALLRVDEVAGYLRLSRDTIYNMVVAGELEGHRRECERSVLLITRRSVEIFLVKTSTLEPGELFARLQAIARRLSHQQRRALAAVLLAD